MRGWFGPLDLALDDVEEIETPVGERCLHCEQPIEDGDAGVRFSDGECEHVECFIRAIVGGVNHQLGLCSCQGGDLPPDPPQLSRREAARQAYKLARTKGAG